MEEAILEREEEIVEIQNLNTHTNILKNNAYKILELSKNHATIALSSDNCERVKESGLIYDGGLLSAASFAATAAINEKNMFLIGVNMDFLNPIKEEEDIIFEADAQITSSGKKVVHVVGKIHDIVFMQGDFMLLKLDEKSLIK
jgi:acyl-CoA thioesterase